MGKFEMTANKAGYLSELYGKALIVYGTGNAGKMVIPYLKRNSNINLLGVTNSRITSDDAGTYLGTGLPLRSLGSWAEHFQNATILIAALRGYDEIYSICHDAGFNEIVFASEELIKASLVAAEDIAEEQLMGNLSSLCLANEIHDTHVASFSEFKACNRGKSVAVVGCGPTLNYYDQVDGIAHIGTNSCFLNERLKLDYYFLLHYIPEWCAELKKYDFTKFFLINRNDNSDDKFPEYVIEENHARRFFQFPLTSRVRHNIEYYPLMGFCSVIFPAIQFALYTRPKHVFLIGCDCSKNGHFDERQQGMFEGDTSIPMWIEGYRKLKTYVTRYYPDTEIISVNPVGLRGMFQDIYTESFLDAFPRIDRSECKTLNL